MKRPVRKIVSKINEPIEPRLIDIENKIDKMNNHILHLAEQLKDLRHQTERIHEIAKADYDGVNRLTRQLAEIRLGPKYAKAFQGEPLISVRIATYNRADKLLDVAIPSVLAQTYKNFEIIVVGDHCTDDTEERIKKLGDKRIQFYNLPSQTAYDKDRVKKWRVIGVPPKIEAASRASGSWIATLDDDDMLTPDHLEKLIKHAKTSGCELVYGAAAHHDLTTGKQKKLYSFPPERGQFTFNSAIYMKELDKVFKEDFKAWVLDEVYDWTMCRRMMEAGVRISSIEDVVTQIDAIPVGHSMKDY
ncbi:MAG TPA: glycosyltransferase family A protein [Candidatus Saccharimonadales bacterium]|nr:glycosyltransferase family A protein [Candidatus Saccharimonadales bacterium]